MANKAVQSLLFNTMSHADVEYPVFDINYFKAKIESNDWTEDDHKALLLSKVNRQNYAHAKAIIEEEAHLNWYELMTHKPVFLSYAASDQSLTDEVYLNGEDWHLTITKQENRYLSILTLHVDDLDTKIIESFKQLTLILVDDTQLVWLQGVLDEDFRIVEYWTAEKFQNFTINPSFTKLQLQISMTEA